MSKKKKEVSALVRRHISCSQTVDEMLSKIMLWSGVREQSPAISAAIQHYYLFLKEQHGK